MKITMIVMSISMVFVLALSAYGEIDKTMVLALSFDSISGGFTPDSSFYGQKAKVNGAVLSAGKFGKALEFDGTDDIVTVEDNPNLLLLSGGTLMVWAFIKTDSGHASWPRIMIKSNTNGGTNGYDFLFDRALSYSIRFCVGGACNSYVATKTNEWHHIAVTFDGRNILIYQDGEEVGKLAQPGAAIDTSGSPLNIGNGIAADRAFQGLLDEVRIWNRPLTKDEVRFQMQRGINEILAVESYSKLAVTWSFIRNKG